MRVFSDDTVGPLAIYAESRSEPYEGQVEVGRVIRRRTANKHFSNGSVVSTVFWPYQFSWTMSTDPQRLKVMQVDDEDPAWKKAVQAWQDSAENLDASGPMHYHADYVPTPSWAKTMQEAFRRGRHIFYVRR